MRLIRVPHITGNNMPSIISLVLSETDYHTGTTVDGRNPKQPPGMYKTL